MHFLTIHIVVMQTPLTQTTHSAQGAKQAGSTSPTTYLRTSHHCVLLRSPPIGPSQVRKTLPGWQQRHPLAPLVKALVHLPLPSTTQVLRLRDSSAPARIPIRPQPALPRPLRLLKAVNTTLEGYPCLTSKDGSEITNCQRLASGFRFGCRLTLA